MLIAGRRSLLLVLVVGLLAAPATAVASGPTSASTSDHAGRALQATGGHVSRATVASQAATFRDDRGNVLTLILDAVGIIAAGTAATFGMTRLLPTDSRPRIALP